MFLDNHPAIACIWEALARKVGNVHRHADFASTSLNDFLLSAAAIQIPYADRGKSVGRTVRNAVEATIAAVGQNTNLGINLLIAPLAHVPPDEPLRSGISKVLGELTVEDAGDVYRAIRLANPGGLGQSAEQDVRSQPTVTLLEAMKLAADRDLIARQYANDFADVFDFGLPAFCDALHRFGTIEATIVETQLRWLAAYPDSLIARKNGSAAAEEVRSRAAAVQELGGIATAEGRRAGVALDRHLRSDGNKLNPGAIADLIAATLYVALREKRVKPTDPFPWRTNEWL